MDASMPRPAADTHPDAMDVFAGRLEPVEISRQTATMLE
jgi:hypothetical protein